MALSYIGAWVLWAGCRPRLAPLVPLPLAPADRAQAVAWARATIPAHYRAIRFKWKFRDQRRNFAGRGTARIAPPDSLRFDYAGPLGLGAGAAVVVEDSVLWADPERNFHTLVPGIPMMWAAFGVVQPPADSAAVYGRAERAAGDSSTVWRFVAGADTLDYVATVARGRILEAEWRQNGKTVARSRTQFDDHAMPATARIDFP